MPLKAPAWVAQRPHLVHTYLYPTAKASEAPEARAPPFRNLKEEDKEPTLCEDLLNALLGFEGQYVAASTKEIAALMVTFHVDRDVDKPLAELVERQLPLCNHHHFIAQYVAKYSAYGCGQVAQAFAAAADAVLKEFMILVGKLEDQVRRQAGFLLQSIWYHLQPAGHNLEALFKICHYCDVAHTTGGALLQVLYQNAKELAGDAQNQALVHFLLEKASTPYFAMLDAWLYQGRIDDPWEEFLIAENPLYRKEEQSRDYIEKYWEQRYTLRESMLPEFLQPYSKKILMTGKYLNVIRECGRDVAGPAQEPTGYKQHHREYGAKIDQAYAMACQRLLRMVVEEEDLVPRLLSLKHYFFLDQADLFTHLITVAEEELTKSCDDINPGKLEALVEHAVRTSTTAQDPFYGDVACELSQVSLSYALRLVKKADGPGHTAITQKPSSGQEAFTLTYRIAWPLSLIVSPRAVWMYQSMFRHLFKCKWVERLLCLTLASSQRTRKAPERVLFVRCFSLRQRMLQFIQNFQYYMTFEVVEPSWQEMVGKVKAAANVDEIMAHHHAFLTHCMDAFLLSSGNLFRIVQALLTSCIVFSEWFPKAVESRGSHGGSSSVAGDQMTLGTTITQFEQQFDNRLRDLLQQLSGSKGAERTAAADPQLRHLIQRLDFNGYYLQRQFYRAESEPT